MTSADDDMRQRAWAITSANAAIGAARGITAINQSAPDLVAADPADFIRQAECYLRAAGVQIDGDHGLAWRERCRVVHSKLQTKP